MNACKKLNTSVLFGILIVFGISRNTNTISGQDADNMPQEKASNKHEAAQSGQNSTLSLTLDAYDFGQPISPYIYGEFIEHQGRCIYGGIWAEMIRDRKFYYPVDTLLYSDPEHKSPWRVIPIGSYVDMDSNHVFVGSHSPRINLDGLNPHGIMQDSLVLQKDKEYVGRIILSGDGSVVVKVSLIWGPGPEDRQTISINQLTQLYAPIPLHFTSKLGTGNAGLEIMAEGTGSVYIGTVSLMPADNVHGMRADVINLLTQLGGTIYRWPGGWFGNGYDWRKCIGDRDKRAPWLNGIYGTKQLEPNDFGPDEFMTFVETIGTEPYIGVSAMMPLDAQMAAYEVEYFNGASSTPMGQLRAANGHPKTYDVRFWGIGCETWGFQALNDYAALHNQIAQAMLATDPTIKIVGVGGLGSHGSEPDQGEWTEGMLTRSADYMDLISEHLYAMPGNSLFEHSRNLAVMVDTFVAAHREFAKELPSLQDKNIRLVLDEWNYFWGGKPYLYGDGGVRNYFKDALGMATALHELLRNSDMIFMANTHPVNVLGHIKTTDTAAAFEVTALPLLLYRRNFGTLPLTVSAIYDSIDVVAALTDDHNYLTVGIINTTAQDHSLKADLYYAELTDAGKWWRISSTDTLAYNEPGKLPEVVIDSGTQATLTPVLEVPAWSISLNKLPIKIEQAPADSNILTFIKTVQVTPDTNFKSGAFARVGYVPATKNLVVTFGGEFFKDSVEGHSGGYAYKEYTLDMQATGKHGTLHSVGGDIGGLMVGNTFYAASMAREGESYGWRLVKYDAVTWTRLADIFFPLDFPREQNGDMMVAFADGRLDICSQYTTFGGPPPPEQGAGTHHQFFSPYLEFLEKKIVSDTPHFCGTSMIYLDSIYYFISASAYTGNVIVMSYDKDWEYHEMKELKRQGHWPTGVAFDGQNFYVAYLDTRQRTEPGFFPYYPNVHLAAFNRNWDLLDDEAVTDYSVSDSLFTGRPWVLLHGNRLYVSYDVVPLPEDLSRIEAFVSVYEIPQVIPSVVQPEKTFKNILLGQNYPNPCNSLTEIPFLLSIMEMVTLKVYDIQGREVTVLVNEVKHPGQYTVIFDTKELQSGVYFYQLITRGYIHTRKCMVVK